MRKQVGDPHDERRRVMKKALRGRSAFLTKRRHRVYGNVELRKITEMIVLAD